MALRRRSRSNLHIPLPEPAPEEWWEGGSTGSIDEDSEYDCGILDLGAETPYIAHSPTQDEHNAFVSQWAQAGVTAPRAPLRRQSSRTSLARDRERTLKRDSVDRDCGICFEFAVVPCRTLCCGKIFCTEHLADWLHGPNAQGRCPNCENLCSLEASTLSLAPPVLLDVPGLSRRRSAKQLKPGAYSPSPLTAVQPRTNDTLPVPPAASHAPVSSSSSATSSAAPSTVPESDEEGRPVPHGLHTSLSPSPFAAASWGAVSRLMSLVTFLILAYKLLS